MSSLSIIISDLKLWKQEENYVYVSQSSSQYSVYNVIGIFFFKLWRLYRFEVKIMLLL